MRMTDEQLLRIADQKGYSAKECEESASFYRARGLCYAEGSRVPWGQMAEECERTARLLREREKAQANLAPTWIEALPPILHNLRYGNGETLLNAREQITRMAQAADKYNETAK